MRSPRSRIGQSHTGVMPTSRWKTSRNSARRSTGISTSWMTGSSCGLPAMRADPAGEPGAPVQGDDAAVHVGAAPPPRPQPAHHRVLHAQRARAPEPVGVPAPDVVLDGQHVLGALVDGAVEDLLPGVVAGTRAAGVVGEPAQREVLVVAGEHGAVDEIGRIPVEVADVGDHLGQVGGVDAHVLQADVARRPAAPRSPGAARSRACRRSWGTRRTGRRARRRASR